MALRNTSDRHGAVAIWLHWLGAFAVLTMLATAAFVWAAPDRPVAVRWLRVHGAWGMIFYVLFVARIGWHIVERRPRGLGTNAALHRIATSVHVALLSLLAFQLLSGPIDVWTGGWPIDVFGWFGVPSPLGTALKPWHDAIGDCHRYAGYAIAGLLTIHIGAAVYHTVVRRDGVLPRMLGQVP